MQQALQIYIDLRNIRPGSHDQTQPWRGHGTDGFGIKPEKGNRLAVVLFFPFYPQKNQWIKYMTQLDFESKHWQTEVNGLGKSKTVLNYQLSLGETTDIFKIYLI